MHMAIGGLGVCMFLCACVKMEACRKGCVIVFGYAPHTLTHWSPELTCRLTVACSIMC